MIKLVGTVVNENLRLVGMVFSGNPRYFNELSPSKEITKVVPLEGSAELFSECKNFKLVNNTITSVNGKDSLNELQVYTTKGDKLDNRMRLTKRVIEDDKVAGYEVTFQFGVVRKFRTADIIKLAGYFRPDNFIVKVRESGVFLTGKAGQSLNTLPSERVETPKYAKKTKRSTIVNKENKQVTAKEDITFDVVGADLLSLLEVLNNAKSYLIAMSNYKRTTQKTTEVSEAFSPLKCGLKAIAEPKLSHSESKIKANVKFKKAGLVAIDGMSPVMAYTWTERTLLINDTNNMDKLGIAIPEENVSSVVAYLKGCESLIKVSEITDEELIKSFKSLTGSRDKNFRFLALDLSGITIMSDKTAQESLMSLEDILNNTLVVEGNKVIIKAIKPIIASLEDKVQTDSKPKVAKMFSMYNEEMLNILKENKIDVATGAFTGVTKSSGGDKEEKEDDVDTAYEISYSVLPSTVIGIKADLLAKQGTNGKVPPIDAKLDAIRNDLATMTESEAKDYLNKIKDKLEKDNSAIIKKLWLHKVAMLKGGKQLHTVDSKQWVEKSNNTKGKMNSYVANVNGLTLTIKVTSDLFIDASPEPVKEKAASKTKKK